MIRSTALAFAYPRAAPLCFPDVAVPQGAVLLLHGASGSGKSTWLSLVAALVAPTAGSLEVAGQPLVGLSQSAADAWRARHLGFLPQKLHLSPALTVADNLALAYWAAGLALNRARIQTCLESLGIADLALARAVLQQPQVLLADEPTASLDDAAAAAAVALLLTTSRAHGATLVIATHDARVDTLLHRGFDAENGIQPAQVLRMQLSKIEQIAPPAQACGAGAAS